MRTFQQARPSSLCHFLHTLKQWVYLRHADIPRGVMSARAGGSVFFAAYSRLLDQWYMVIPNGEEKIPPPTQIFVECDDEPATDTDTDATTIQLELPL